MKTLYIMRHAKSDWSDLNLSDEERPLNKRGLKDAPNIGKCLRKMKKVPEQILSSPAVRARKTALAVKEQAQVENDIQDVEGLYPGVTAEYFSAAANLPDHIASAMLIGHNPAIEGFVAELVANGELNLKFPTAAIAIVKVDALTWQDVRAGEGELRALLTPKMLKKL